MGERLFKYLLFVISLIFLIYVLTLSLARFYYLKSMAVKNERNGFYKGIEYIKKAIRFNPLDSTFYYLKYQILNDKYRYAKRLSRAEREELIERQLREISRAIEAEPTKALYHMSYALAIMKETPAPDTYTRNAIIRELEAARDLKPFSELYRKIYSDYIMRSQLRGKALK